MYTEIIIFSNNGFLQISYFRYVGSACRISGYHYMKSRILTPSELCSQY